LLSPVRNDLAPEKALRPRVHLTSNLLRCSQEQRVPRERQLQIALIVERHRLDLAQRVFSVKHPAVGARKQRIRHVANAVVQRLARLRAGSSTLDPLPFQILGNRTALKTSRPSIGNSDPGPRDLRIRVEKPDWLGTFGPSASPVQPRLHQRLAIAVERCRRLNRRQRLRRQDVRIASLHPVSQFDHFGRLSSFSSSYKAPSRDGPTLLQVLVPNHVPTSLAGHHEVEIAVLVQVVRSDVVGFLPSPDQMPLERTLTVVLVPPSFS